MKENVGTAEAIVRGIVGASLLGFGFMRGTRQSLLRRRPMIAPLLAAAAGSALFETAITRVCPLSRALGIDTTRSAPALAGA